MGKKGCVGCLGVLAVVMVIGAIGRSIEDAREKRAAEERAERLAAARADSTRTAQRLADSVAALSPAARRRHQDSVARVRQRTADSIARAEAANRRQFAQQQLEARREFARRFDSVLLEEGFNVKSVRAQGTAATTLHIEFVLCSRAFIHNIAKAMHQQVAALGFKRVQCYDGYDERWWVDLN